MPEQCSAKSKQTGKRCKQKAVPGAVVCHYHGGAAPQVERCARERLAAMVDPALDALHRILKADTKDRIPKAVVLNAAKQILKSNGYAGADELAVEQKQRGPIQIQFVD